MFDTFKTIHVKIMYELMLFYSYQDFGFRNIAIVLRFEFSFFTFVFVEHTYTHTHPPTHTLILVKISQKLIMMQDMCVILAVLAQTVAP